MAASDDVGQGRATGRMVSREAKELYWKAAKGLQDVDGLETSPYLGTVAEGHIVGMYSAHEAVNLLEAHYRKRSACDEEDARKEADLVAARIVRLLTDGDFSLKPSMLACIHGTLFEGLLPRKRTGAFRDCNISKREPVLAYRSVGYAPWQTIRDNLAYDFGEFQRGPLIHDGLVNEEKLETFIANIWQTHPFIEGNTRTVAVFLVLLLRSAGLGADLALFEKHSLFFRNALVRASYSSIRDGVAEDRTGLHLFFENLLDGGKHKLCNRDLFSSELFGTGGLKQAL